MPGGTFDPMVGKVRAGLYMNFEAVTQDRIKAKDRGTVMLPLFGAKWGPAEEFIALDTPDTFNILGYDINELEMLLVKEAFKNAKKVIVYRPTDGTKATKTAAPLTVTAAQSGTRGNDIKVVIAANPVAGKDVTTYVGLNKVDEQIGVTTVEDLTNNAFAVFSGTGDLADSAGIVLAGGADGTQTPLQVTTFLEACETQFFDTIAFPTDDATLHSSFDTKIKYFREDIGKRILGIRPGLSADYEGVTVVKNGVILADGTTLTAKDATAWVAGAEAAANVNKSLTYMPYDAAVDANPRMKHTDIVAGLKGGFFIFTNDGEKVIVEKDQNSLTTLTPTKTKKFTKNRVLRCLDGINNDLLKAFTSQHIGKLDNNPDGWGIARTLVMDYMLTLQDIGAVKNVDPDNDFIVNETLSVDDEMYADIGAEPVDATEKFYFTVKVR